MKQNAYGTNAAYCNKSNPGAPFISTYNAINKTLSFKLQMSIEGLVDVYFMIKNDLESLRITTTATVSSISCNRPLLDIKNRAKDFLKPMIMKRAQMFSIVGITILNCSTSLENSKQWFVYQINQNDGSILKKISLTNILSEFNAELFIPNNFLSFETINSSIK